MRDMEHMGRTEPGTMLEEATTNYFELLENVPSRFFYFGAITAFFGSAFMFFVGRRSWGLFLGQLVPTMLVLPLFHRIMHPSRERTMPGVEEFGRQARQMGEEFRHRAEEYTER